MSDSRSSEVNRGCDRSTHSQVQLTRGGGVVFHGSWKGTLLDEGRNTCSPREHRKFTYGKQLGESIILPITSILHAFNLLTLKLLINLVRKDIYNQIW